MSDNRIRRLEQNYELLRTELLQVKQLAQEHQRSVAQHDLLRDQEMKALRDEVEKLRIENARLREEVTALEEAAPVVPLFKSREGS